MFSLVSSAPRWRAVATGLFVALVALIVELVSSAPCDEQ